MTTETALTQDAGNPAPVVRLAYPTYHAARPPRPGIKWDKALTALKVLGVVLALMAYPAMVLLSHDLDDAPVNLDEGRHWAASDVGVAATLLSRELDGPGWTGDLHRWHPQVRLTALPAWQESLIEAIAGHGRLTLSLFEGQRDPDLEAAVRLLGRATSEDTVPGLVAAREALTRYDGRVSVGLAGRPDGPATLAAELQLFAAWADSSIETLAPLASPGDGWIASRASVAALYEAKARAHVAHELLVARIAREPRLADAKGFAGDFEDALNAWRRAARIRPLFVANQASDGAIGTNHLATMAFLLGEAGKASRRAAAVLLEPEPAIQDTLAAHRPADTE